MLNHDWSTSCVDWERRVVASESLISFDPLFPDQADLAMRFFNELRIVDALGSPTMGEAARPWMTDFARAIFGAYNPKTGRRLINEFLLLVSKKNGKSTLCAAIMLTALLMNWRKSGEFIVLAPTKEVADNSFEPMRDMVRADDDLSAMLHVQAHLRKITHLGTNATIKVVAADSDTVSGKKAIGVFVDELHEFGKRAKASNMLLEATGGLASRPEGFVIYASTQSELPPAGVFRQKLQYARKVRDGTVNDRKFLPLIYEFPQQMLDEKAYLDLQNAYVTNPNWGLSVDVERISQIHAEYLEEGEGKYLEFAAKHLNVQISTSLANDRWAGADYWEGQGDQKIGLSYLIAECEVLCVGIDGGGLDDLLGLCVLGRHKDTKEWLAWCRAWAHPSVLERRKEIAPRLRDFAADGDLVLVESIGEDVDELAQIVAEVNDSKLLDKVGADPAGIGSVLDALEERGIPSDKLVAVSQGWKLSGTIKTAERRLADGTLKHAAQPMMAWCVGNAKTVPVGNAINITKQISGSAKIDPLMALFDAVQLMALNPDSKRGRKTVMMMLG